MGKESAKSEVRVKKKTVIVTAALVAIVCTVGIAVAVTFIGVVESQVRTPFTPPSDSILGKFRTAAVAADGAPCSQIGRDVLAEGGNAVDAALAALFCIGAVHPQSAGIGGGFLMTVYDSRTGTARCLNAREVAPLAATENMFNGNAAASSKGPLSVGVPGEVAGYWAAHQRYGRLPWARLVQPSITLAIEGVAVNWHLAGALEQEADNIKAEPSMWDFLNAETGQVLKEGEILKRPAFGQTLRTIAEYGADVLYNGSLADQLVEDIQKRGGIITLEDLQNYRPEWVDPVRVELNNKLTLLSVPPPGSGVLAAFILNILDNYQSEWRQLKKSGRDVSLEPLTYHRIAESFKHAYAQRTRLGDPCCNATFEAEIQQLVQNLTSEVFAREAYAKINDSTTYNDPDFYGAVLYNPNDSGTSHVSVLDADGMAVSATTTINLYFGAGFASSQTGIIYNDEMDDFSSPNITNAFGIPPSPANFIRPGKRPLSSMAPSVLIRTDTNQTRLVVGAAGGTKITTSIVYTMIRNIWFQENIKEAIDSMRIHHQLFPMEFQYELPDFPQDIVDAMVSRHHNISTYRRGAVVSAISVEDDGIIYANTDWRKTGIVAGIDPVP